jgi:hypothetical protein
MVAYHAHKCTVCESRGISTVWIHGDDKFEDIAAHKCPKCGSQNLRKWMVEVAQVPNMIQQQQQQQAQRGAVQVIKYSDALMLAFTYALFILAVVAIAQNWDSIISYLAKSKK